MENNWDSVAKLRRNQIENGKDLTFSRVFLPFYTSLIATLRPTSVLEVGVGTGHLALELSKYVSRYLGIDPSRAMIEEAADVLVGTTVELVKVGIEELQSDETFDLVLSHMCLQTIKEAPGFLDAVARFVSAGGIYVIAIPHPAFFNDYKRVIQPEDFTYMNHISAEIDFSITLDPQGVIRRVPYTHRPLSQYFSELAEAGLSVLFLNEIFPSSEIQELYGSPWEAPRYLVLSGSRYEAGFSETNNSMSHRLLRYR